MFVQKLVLRNFRNYDYLDLDFDPKLNLIVGDNGVGKTNIVEGIQFLSLARSFRTLNSTDLIKEKRQFATIEARVVENTTSKDIVAILTPTSKKISCNNKQIKRISELASLVNVIVFEPKDSLMFSDSPLIRRNFLDINLSKKSPLYLNNLMVYERLLKERNMILKLDKIDMTQLDVVTKRLIEVSEDIVKYRSLYICEINRVLSKIISQIKGLDEVAQLEYHPFVKCDEHFNEYAIRAYERALESDIKRKMTTIGIHREDYVMMLNGKDITSFGSQGENRIAVIALKLAPFFLVEDRDKRPIIVLDDVMSELDEGHKNRLIAFLRKFEQVFITSTTTNVQNASIYEVDKNQKITRRNS